MTKHSKRVKYLLVPWVAPLGGPGGVGVEGEGVASFVDDLSQAEKTG